MIIKGKNISEIHRDNMDLKILSKKEDFQHASATIIKLKDAHGQTSSEINDRLYYVLEDKGVFTINGKVNDVEKEDLIIIPKNTEYNFEGDLTVFVVHVPAFEP